jgi:hypothetical protein
VLNYLDQLKSEEVLAYTAFSSVSHLIDTGENCEDRRKETIVPLDSLTGQLMSEEAIQYGSERCWRMHWSGLTPSV